MSDPRVNTPVTVAAPAPAAPRAARAGADRTWYKHAVIYELHVRAFHDSNADGIGDFRGLTSKLDYLQDLGVTAIWLLPFYPSPLRDDGYDIADYTRVNESYGSMSDARLFIREAHRRGLRVITELVLNHTSDQHPWFQRARHAPPGSRWRDFYVWSDSPSKYADARIIFKDFETSNWTWDPVAEAYYWHRFYAHQPDLNFENPAVHEALRRVVAFWFDAGVDGLRLDAVPYLYEQEGTSCENLPETHEFLRKLRSWVEERYPGSMLLAEANQWPEDAVAYFGDGNECHMAFHFPLMPRLFMALRMEDRFPIIDILRQTPTIPDVCQWALFLRNHDELTLEMVTDEERDYMYRVYAEDRRARINLGIRRRLAPLLENHRAKIELMNGLLFSLPGTPVLYYGDEIGMGDNIYLGDRNGVRTPMQWSGDRNAGFSRANPQQLYLPTIIDPEYHYEAINVEAQQNNPSSLLWWMKQLIALRKRHQVFGDGELEFVVTDNARVLAFTRRDDSTTVLVVANLSRFAQPAELDLSAFVGMTPVEMFGHTPFPPIGQLPYFITLGPYSFHWFSLEQAPTTGDTAREHPERPAAEPEPETPVIRIGGRIDAWFRSGEGRERLTQILADTVPRARWFRAKARHRRHVQITDWIPLLSEPDLQASLAVVEFEFYEGETQLYVVPLAVGGPSHTAYVFGTRSTAILARLEGEGNEHALLYDAMVDPAVSRALLDVMLRRRQLRGDRGRITGTATRSGRRLASADEKLDVTVSKAEQSNSSVIFGNRLILKLFRVIEPGVNPDLEISRHLSERVGIAQTPPFGGALEYVVEREEPMTVALLQGLVDNEGDGWRQILGELSVFYETVLSMPADRQSGVIAPGVPLVTLAGQDVPDEAREHISRTMPLAELLGQRTAQMHDALATGDGDPAFMPEPITPVHQRSLYQSLRNSTQRSLAVLRDRWDRLPERHLPAARAVLDREEHVMGRLREVTARPLTGMRIRCHGDYHLGQVLWTGRDYVVIDFEGEPARPLTERRLKGTPLRDVAGMLRSYHYAAHAAIQELAQRGVVDVDSDAAVVLQRWARYWYTWTAATFLGSYLGALRQLKPRLLPADEAGLRVLLEAWMLEKAMYEISYELNNRPDWVGLPLAGALEMLSADEPA